jgi:hypothetical protein
MLRDLMFHVEHYVTLYYLSIKRLNSIRINIILLVRLYTTSCGETFYNCLIIYNAHSDIIIFTFGQ